MRHFRLSGPVAALAFGVGVTATQTVLIAPPRVPNRALAYLFGTACRAVAVAAIAVAAYEHCRAAGGAQKASSWNVHRPIGPVGKSPGTCALWNTSRATSPVLGLRGAASELAWRLGPVSRLRFHWLIRVLPHRRR